MEVVVIAFAPAFFARAWREEVCPELRILLDPERRAYRAFGLRRSWLRAWNWPTVRRYIELLRQGRAWKGIQGDSAQLGGDFLLDAAGTVRLAHPSHDPTDRPVVEEVVALLHDLEREGLLELV